MVRLSKFLFPIFMYFAILARFLSFCRVGTGLSDEELATLVAKLKPHFRYIVFVSAVALLLV